MSHSSRLGADRVSRTLASNRLGVPAVVFFVLSAATPLTVVAGVVTTGFAVTGVIGLPIAFVAIAALLALFSVGYVAMSRHITNAGAFYTYVTHGLGRPAGVAAAYMALLAYNLLQVGLYGIIGVAAAPQLEEWFGITLDWWVIALIAWAIVGFLGLLRIDVNGTVLAVLLLTEMAIIIIYSIASLANPADGEVTFDTLQVGNLFESGVGAILVLAVLGFVGFEASVVYSEESRDPKRTIALATYISIAVVAAVYVLASWAMSVATGPDNIVAFAQQNADQTIFVLADSFLGSTWVDIGSALFITSVLAAMISFHNTVARYVFALGRERVLPSALGRTSPSSGAPVAASIVQSVVGLVVILVYVLFDLDPLVQLFFYLGTTGGFGVLTLVTLTSVAVLAFFARHPSGENPWRRIVAPTLATVLLVIVVVLAIANYDILIGVAPDAPERWILPGLFLVAALIGLLWALFLKSSRPEVYDAIGRGANAATGISVLDLSTEEEPGQPSLR
ncbi:APC family permease [Jiangella aurantiaca]|uniref:APC family permease n=1 Tax=Jiangella aurantiaca TaxID=2530373 RepID=A0A4R5ADY3_9ACTN|nr:APC family permease [Jiangella aurantiaca]TDD68092.1 APC family permease [Jiangella aurantiaca]